VHEASRLLILDGYVSGQLAIFLHVQAFLERDAIDKIGLELPAAKTGPTLTSFILHLNTLNVSLRNNGNKESVFVSVVKIVNGPNGVIPSTARLYRVNHEAIELGAKDVYFGFRERAFYLFDSFPDRELSPIILKGRRDSLNSLEPCIVQRRPEVVDGIAKHKCNIVECVPVSEFMFQNLSTHCRVNVNARGIAAFQSGNARFYILDVGIGPLNLESSVSE
jgi:hypothetical protein